MPRPLHARARHPHRCSRYQSAREVADVLADCEAQLKANSKLKDYSRIPQSLPPRSGRRKWMAAAAVLWRPVIVLAATEFAGVTHVFRNRDATPDHPDVAPGPIAQHDPTKKSESPKKG